jgi:AMMECR1 domain-containing protein
LTEPQPLVFQSNEELLQYLQHDQPGVVLRLSERIVTYLPQVWTRIPDPLMFLDSLCEKAGYMPGVWRQGGTISTYRAECFQELASAPPNQAK